MTGETTFGLPRDQSPGDVLASLSVPQFEAELARRAKVPSDKLNQLMRSDEKHVRVEAEAVGQILKRFARAVVDSMEDPDGVEQFLGELDLKAISRDHHWRTIFAELRNRDRRYEQHKRVLVIKYLQYLSFRKKLLDYIHERKLGLQETANHPDLTIFPSPGDPNRSAEGATRPVGEFSRLPIGESVTMQLSTGGAVHVMFARHLFRILGPENPCLVDQNGVTHFLKPGRNMVGRHPESDIVLDRDFHDVSRAHAIIEWSGAGELSVTDLSTRGTYIPTSVMQENRAHLLDVPSS